MSGKMRWVSMAVAGVCVLGVVLYLLLSGDSSDGSGGGGAESLAGAQLMARAVDPQDPDGNGRVFLVKEGRQRPLEGGDLRCERVYFAAGRGLCLTTAEGETGPKVLIFDSDSQVLQELALPGLPSRARVSRDGRYGATTAFVNGHGYEAAGGFTTATTLIDMRRLEPIADLESFEVDPNGRPIEKDDLDYWGVTFARDSDRFYATLRSGDHHYLVRGSVSGRSLEILADGIECPSLSPDGKQIAYKSRIGEDDLWHLEVFDLATRRSHRVAEPRSIDDQAEWLNDQTLVYSDGLNLYSVAADGTGAPRMILREASSPVALAPTSSSGSKPPPPTSSSG